MTQIGTNSYVDMIKNIMRVIAQRNTMMCIRGSPNFSPFQILPPCDGKEVALINKIGKQSSGQVESISDIAKFIAWNPDKPYVTPLNPILGELVTVDQCFQHWITVPSIRKLVIASYPETIKRVPEELKGYMYLAAAENPKVFEYWKPFDRSDMSSEYVKDLCLREANREHFERNKKINPDYEENESEKASASDIFYMLWFGSMGFGALVGAIVGVGRAIDTSSRYDSKPYIGIRVIGGAISGGCVGLFVGGTWPVMVPVMLFRHG